MSDLRVGVQGPKHTCIFLKKTKSIDDLVNGVGLTYYLRQL